MAKYVKKYFIFFHIFFRSLVMIYGIRLDEICACARLLDDARLFDESEYNDDEGSKKDRAAYLKQFSPGIFNARHHEFKRGFLHLETRLKKFNWQLVWGPGAWIKVLIEVIL